MRDIWSLEDRVAVITGGLSGIALATAETLTEWGAHIVLADIHSSAEEAVLKRVSRPGRRVEYFNCDVSDTESVKSLASSVKDSFGRLDILFNNAASCVLAPVESMTDEQWDTTISVSARGTFLCCRELGKLMIEQRSGSIVNMASVAALIGLPRGTAHHAAAKGGIISFTKTLAVEWAKYGIRVNALAPGQISTPPLEEIMANPEYARQILDAIPMGRVGEPREVAAAVLYLCSDAGAFVNGHTLVIDGGATIA